MQRKNFMRRSLGPAVSIVLFAVAGWLLHNELRVHHFGEIVAAFQSLPNRRLWAALGLTLAGYLVMTGYDLLALRYVGHPLPVRNTTLAAFIGYAFSNNIGFSMVAGASVRYRLYAAWGLTTAEITRVVVFCSLTLWLGFFLLSGLILSALPLQMPPTLTVPLPPARVLGIGLLAVVSCYAAISIFRKQPIRIRTWEIRLPSLPLAAAQLVVAALDWLLAGLVLYVLVGSSTELTLHGFLPVFLLAQLAGLVSQVPGGLGVFETVVVLLLSPRLPVPHMISALLAYRAIYYWLPLIAAALLLGLEEFLHQRKYFGWLKSLFETWVASLVPQILGIAAFLAGAVLLLSGATPAVDVRLHALKQVFPLLLVEVSHFVGSLAGMGLLLLGRGLQRRLDAAYVLTVVLLIVGMVASLIKGFDFEEAAVLLLILLAVLPCRRHFYRRASLFSQRFSAGWIVAVVIVLATSIWLGYYANRHVEYAGSLWWKFAFNSDASRFLRATVGAVVLGLFFAGARLMRPAPPLLEAADSQRLAKAMPVIRNCPDTYANLALLGDKRLLFSQSGSAFIMYAVGGRSWVAMGDPVGDPQEIPDLIWQFRELSDRYGGWTVFYQVGHDSLHLYLDLGLSLQKLGEEARVPLMEFSLEGSRRKGLRYTRNKLQKQGCRFEVLPPEQTAAFLPELRQVSDAWLAAKSTREKGFSLGYFQPQYLGHFSTAVVRVGDSIVAFANLWESGGHQELSVDLMRYFPNAFEGVMEYLFIEIMLWGRQRGFAWFNLGMAPLSGIEDRSLAPLWNRVAAFIARHGEHFYNFEGLRSYKEKFDPVWEPRYLASPGGMALARVLTHLATLISGGITGVVAK
jgi:phosphatidylglycerol lysyltransferase